MIKILGIIVAVVLMGGGMYYVVQNKQNDGQGDPSRGTHTGTARKTVLHLIKEGKDQKCTVKAGVSNLQTMIVYVSNGKARTEYLSPQGGSGGISAIANDATMEVHSWTLKPGEAEPLGFLHTFDGRAAYEAFMTSDPLDSTGMAEEVGDARCEQWTPDLSVFTLPPIVFYPVKP